MDVKAPQDGQLLEIKLQAGNRAARAALSGNSPWLVLLLVGLLWLVRVGSGWVGGLQLLLVGLAGTGL